MELIKIETRKINQELVQTISARELHEFLESRQQFSDWIKNRIKTFVQLHKFMELQTEGVHYISLDMAKELSMVEKKLDVISLNVRGN